MDLLGKISEIKEYGHGRRCEICRCKMSSRNPADICQAHFKPMAIFYNIDHSHGQIELRRSDAKKLYAQLRKNFKKWGRICKEQLLE